MEPTTAEYLLTSMVIKRAIQMASAINARAADGAPRVEAADQLEAAIEELKSIHPIVMKALRQTE